MSEVSEQANEWAQRSARAKRVIQNKQTSEQCKRTSEWMSEWLSTYVSILVCSRPQCNVTMRGKSEKKRERELAWKWKCGVLTALCKSDACVTSIFSNPPPTFLDGSSGRIPGVCERKEKNDSQGCTMVQSNQETRRELWDAHLFAHSLAWFGLLNSHAHFVALDCWLTHSLMSLWISGWLNMLGHQAFLEWHRKHR